MQNGAATNKRGRALKLFHGTTRFGHTIFDTTKAARGTSSIFTTTNESVANGYSEFGENRKAGSAYVQDDGTDKTLIKNAKNVLNADWRRITSEDVQKIRAKLMEEFRKMADAETKAMNESPDYYPPEEIETPFWYAADPFTYLVEEDERYFDENEEWAKEYRERQPLRNYYEDYKKVEEYFRDEANEEEYQRFKKEAPGFYNLFMRGYDHSDALISLEYKYKKLLDAENMFYNEKRGTVLSREELQHDIDVMRNRGNYSLYGFPGENPLEVDAQNNYWLNIKVPEIGDGLYSTDQIAKWAQKNGYTSVIIHNVLDPAVVNEYGDDYIFFNSDQVKSADPITYDEDGNVIPPSERFTSNHDIRYSLDQGDMDVREWMKGLKESSVSTMQEKLLLKQYQTLADEIKRDRSALEKRRQNLNALVMKPEYTARDRRMILEESATIEQKQDLLDDKERKMTRITSKQGFAKLMYEQSQIMNDLVNGRTVAEVRQGIENMSSELGQVQQQMAEREKEIADLKQKAVDAVKSLDNVPGAEDAASQLKQIVNQMVMNERSLRRSKARIDEVAGSAKKAGTRAGNIQKAVRAAVAYNNKLTEQSEAVMWEKKRRLLLNTLQSEHAQAMINQRQEFEEKLERDKNIRNMQAENMALRKRINTNVRKSTMRSELTIMVLVAGIKLFPNSRS